MFQNEDHTEVAEEDSTNSEKSDESAMYALLEEQNEDLLRMVHLMATCLESKQKK